MEEKLRKYVEVLFEGAPKTRKSIELRQEIYTNLLDRYQDLRGNGATEEEAYEIVKNSIGNVDELIQSLDETTKEDREALDENRKKSALLNSIAIILYIMSPVFIIVLASRGYWMVGIVLLLACVAVATGIKVYAGSVYPSYKKEDETVVEEFKEWKAENEDKAKQKNMYSGVVWSLITALYFIISFTTMAWHVSWIIFIIGGAIDQLIKINIYNK